MNYDIHTNIVTLRGLAQQAGIPLYTLAKALGVKPSTFASWQAGRRGVKSSPVTHKIDIRIEGLKMVIQGLIHKKILPTGLPPGREREIKSTAVLKAALRELKKK